jgi:hypothetical protein
MIFQESDAEIRYNACVSVPSESEGKVHSISEWEHAADFYQKQHEIRVSHERNSMFSLQNVILVVPFVVALLALLMLFRVAL